MRSLLLPVFVAALAAVCAPACGNDEPESMLQDVDFEALEEIEVKFDRNSILDLATLTDFEALDATATAEFLNRSPYQRPSFLATYQSNGTPASAAIARAARSYRINPLVFLVLAQARSGLVGAREYPFPPERVEYVFGCGCLAKDNCLPELAGFDRQVDCLGRRLRTAIDTVAIGAQQTDGGWGKDKTSTTLDGLKVTPSDVGTAVLYDLTPAVREGKEGGNWMVWNLFQRYAVSAQYGGPFGDGEGRPVGDACQTDAICAGENAVCALGEDFPEGMCTAPCDGLCAPQDGQEPFCALLTDSTGYCFKSCNRSAPNCREGYECARVTRFGGTEGEGGDVCIPPALLGNP